MYLKYPHSPCCIDSMRYMLTESHTSLSFPHLTPEPPFFPRERQMFSQLGWTQPLTGRLEFKPELEELTQDHQLPQKLGFLQVSFFKSGPVTGKRQAHANVLQRIKGCDTSVHGTCIVGAGREEP